MLLSCTIGHSCKARTFSRPWWCLYGGQILQQSGQRTYIQGGRTIDEKCKFTPPPQPHQWFILSFPGAALEVGCIPGPQSTSASVAADSGLHHGQYWSRWHVWSCSWPPVRMGKSWLHSRHQVVSFNAMGLPPPLQLGVGIIPPPPRPRVWVLSTLHSYWAEISSVTSQISWETIGRVGLCLIPDLQAGCCLFS